MKKQFVLALALLVGAYSFAQKKELRDVEKAIKKNNFAEAKALLNQVEPMMASADSKLQDKYYFLKGEALYANGAGSAEELQSAVENFDKVTDGYTSEINEVKTKILSSVLTKAQNFLENKKFAASSKGFEQAYKLSPKDTMYLYYAASTAVNGQDFDTALKMYEELRDLGYTGIKMEYYATNKETGEVESFGSKQVRDLSVKAGTHNNPEDKKSEPVFAEIVKNIALIYNEKGEDEKAIEAMKDAREANPDNVGLIITEANLYHKLGNDEKFKSLMEEAAEKYPDNENIHYNIGVMKMKSGDLEGARVSFRKALELKSDFADAAINISTTYLDEGNALIEEMNNLGTSAADNKKYDELNEQKKELFNEAAKILEDFIALNPGDVELSIYQQLQNIYKATYQKDKADALNDKILELGG